MQPLSLPSDNPFRYALGIGAPPEVYGICVEENRFGLSSMEGKKDEGKALVFFCLYSCLYLGLAE